MNKDKLTSSQRMNALINGEKLDRIPFIPLGILYAGNLAGLSSEEFFLNPQNSFDAQIMGAEFQGYDGAPGFDLPGWSGWDFGGEISYLNDNRVLMPRLKRLIVETSKDVEKLEVPDLKKAPGFQKRLEFHRIARKNKFSVSIPAGSPLEIVGQIIEPSILMRWFRKKPELVHRLLRLSVDYILHIADYYIKEFGAVNCSAFSSYPLESNTMISAKMFKEFSLPYMIEVHDKLKEKGIKEFGIHLCGDHRSNLEFFKEINLPERSIISVSEKMDIEVVAKEFGEEYIIGGNVPTKLIRMGKPNEVFNASKDVIEKMKYHKGGFILMPSCDLPPLTPPLNVYMMLKAVREFGRYT